VAEPELTREAVEQAVAECRTSGRARFLEQYGYGGARDYFLTIDGENYDSKAIVGVAHKFLPGGTALRHDQLSGGLSDAAGKLQALGFTITTPAENADWSWDEHVLALDLYMDNPQSPPGKTSKQIADLSATLGRLGERMDVQRNEKFRNTNGVYMKLMNFRRLDPAFQAEGKAGLSQGAKGEQKVWDRFSGRREELRQHAAAIRAAIADLAVPLAASPDDEDDGTEEGAVILRLHQSRERDGRLSKKKKTKVLKDTGNLACEVCAFDFASQYGDHGVGYAEVHHIKPVSQLSKGEKTRLVDLAVVCANCHRMLHRKGLLDVALLRLMVGDRRA
jgi:5-methylcytosine-specific restriction protein A